MKYMALNERVYLVGEFMKNCYIVFVISFWCLSLSAPGSPPGGEDSGRRIVPVIRYEFLPPAGDEDLQDIPLSQIPRRQVPPLLRSPAVTPLGFVSFIPGENPEDSDESLGSQ